MKMIPKKTPKKQVMSIEDYQEFIKVFPNAIPKKKWKEPARSKTMKAEVPESALQKYADEILELKKYRSLRFPDGFLGWIKLKAPLHIKKIFFSIWGGRPDNTFMIPLGSGYYLAVPMELKTQDKKGRAVGRLHGKQINNARNEEWFIARSVDQINDVIKRAEETALKIRYFFEQNTPQ